ncbi:hypothetical protein HYV50_00405 [Candidatus Pacearchaeota archaeon]|nr:hypothetical protein [Candidatus Pacearchaeota archaeon]
MVSLEHFVEQFPSKIVSRMTPPHSSFRQDVLKLESSPKEKISYGKETGGSVFYRGCRIRFASSGDENRVIVVLDSLETKSIDLSKFSEILEHPESFSNASKERKAEYLGIFSKGEILDNLPKSDNMLMVGYNLKRTKKLGQDEIFEAFWYVFKPVLNILP